MKADINVTPLIDVLLVILIIFMLVVPVTPTKLDAALPETKATPTRPDPRSLVLEVRAEVFALNTTPFLTRTALTERLRASFSERRDTTVFVRVASGVSYDRVIDAIDAAREAGAGRIGLVDQPVTGP